MEISDSVLLMNRDWDPDYLCDILSEDFFDLDEMWCSNITDSELVNEVNRVEKYSPITEDISLEDEVLCSAVERIEEELVMYYLENLVTRFFVVCLLQLLLNLLITLICNLFSGLLTLNQYNIFNLISQEICLYILQDQDLVVFQSLSNLVTS